MLAAESVIADDRVVGAAAAARQRGAAAGGVAAAAASAALVARRQPPGVAAVGFGHALGVLEGGALAAVPMQAAGVPAGTLVAGAQHAPHHRLLALRRRAFADPDDAAGALQ